MKKICSVVGARPQFIKLAVVSREIRKYFDEVIIHTGQHYDYNMSDVFFDELDIPKPDYNLGISGGTHGKMTGEMIIETEKVLMNEKPDLLLLFGDTNSTMAAAIAGVKLGIPIAHIESGNRTGDLDNPEEANRVVTDHLSTLLFACVESSMDFLGKEGKAEKSYLVGDPMYDAFLYYSAKNDGSELHEVVDFSEEKVEIPDEFYYLTCHRQENTGNDKNLYEILSAMNTLDCKTIYPVHPRSQGITKSLCQKYNFENIILTKPVGYLTSISLVNKAKKIVSDSGGVQREAFFAKKQHLSLFNLVAWPETLVGNCNQLSISKKDVILEKLSKKAVFDDNYLPFGDGNCAVKICDILRKYFND